MVSGRRALASGAASRCVTAAAAKESAAGATLVRAGAKRINDDVEDLHVVALVLDVPLEKRRGVALARRLLTSWKSCGRRDSAGQARGRFGRPWRRQKPSPAGEAIERRRLTVR